MFVDYQNWLQAGMALKLAFGDDGLQLWALTHDGTVTPEVEESKWTSFASEPQPGSTTLLSLIARARELGWRGTIRKTAVAMFPTVTLPAASLAGPAGGLPMLAGEQVLCEFARPIVTDFLTATADRRPPRASGCPTLPESMSAHGLYDPLREAIPRIIAISENGPKLFKHDREAVIEPLAVLQVVHADTFDAVRRRVVSFGCELPDRKIKHAAAALLERVDRTFVSGDWQMDLRGSIENDNPDNVAVFLGIIGCELRWNAWRERMEVRGGNDPELTWEVWTYVDDTIVAKLRTRAMRTKTRFRPAKEFLWESLLALAHKNPVDPVLDRLAELQAAWDKQPRLDSWLSAACHVPTDLYRQAVARNIIGGLVHRARRPGTKHDTMAVLFGPQGTGKSTLAKIIALDLEWFSDSILLGDASKELVLLLAGKLVVEISEMSARNSANASGIKAMVSRDVDAGRTAYARAVTERPRRNIFVGTTNDNEPLQDPSGNRRFLPVQVTREINLAWLRANIGQIIGEAATLEAAGDDFAIPRDVWGIAAEHADAARSQSDIEIMFREWFAETPHTASAYITASDLTTLCQMAGLRSSNSHRSAIMQSIGFRIERPYIGGKQSAVWFRGPAGLPKSIEREGVRYMIGMAGNGRAQVAIRTDRAPSLLPPHMPLTRSPVG